MNWIPTRLNEIPRKAIVGGQTKEMEFLYIGRARCKGTALIIGKVQPTHKCCYVTFEGKEFKFEDYEILVSIN